MLKKVFASMVFATMLTGVTFASPAVGIMTINEHSDAQEEAVENDLLVEDSAPDDEENAVDEEESYAEEDAVDSSSDNDSIENQKPDREDSKMVQNAKLEKQNKQAPNESVQNIPSKKTETDQPLETSSPDNKKSEEAKPKETKQEEAKPEEKKSEEKKSEEKKPEHQKVDAVKANTVPFFPYSPSNVSVSSSMNNKYSKAKLLVSSGEEKVLLDIPDLFLCPDEVVFSKFSFFVSDTQEEKDGIKFSVLSPDGFVSISLPNKTTETITWLDEDVHFTILLDGVVPMQEPVKSDKNPIPTTERKEQTEETTKTEIEEYDEEDVGEEYDDVSVYESNEPMVEVSDEGEVLYVP